MPTFQHQLEVSSVCLTIGKPILAQGFKSPGLPVFFMVRAFTFENEPTSTLFKPKLHITLKGIVQKYGSVSKPCNYPCSSHQNSW